MKIQIITKEYLPSLEEIEAFERSQNLSLPKEYEGFLMQFSGGEPETNVFKITENNDSGVNKFMDLGELASSLAVYKNRIPDWFLPIAHAEGGNLVGIGMSGDNTNKIFFWDHEGEELDESKKSTNKNIYLLSDTLNSFLTNIEPFSIKDIKLRPGQVKSVWIDPEMLK